MTKSSYSEWEEFFNETVENNSTMTPLRYDWYDNNDGKVFKGITYNLKFKRIIEGMVGTVYQINNPSNFQSFLINTQEELNECINRLFMDNPIEIIKGNHNITK
jgi:hypothetical protein